MVFFLLFFDKGNEVTSDFPFSPHVSMHGGETKVTGVSRARPIAHIGFSREENTRKKENFFTSFGKKGVWLHIQITYY